MSFRDVVLFVIVLSAVFAAVRFGGGSALRKQHSSVASEISTESNFEGFSAD